VAQEPAPSQVPFCPQVAGGSTEHVPRGSGAPRSTGEHLPVRPGSAHDIHTPPQAASQQTPCAQKPLAHSPLVVQLTTNEHTPSTQCLPPQSAGVAHFFEQERVVASQSKGAHDNAPAGAHVPWPSHASLPTIDEP
jgi:hypothetical protein